MQIIDMTFQVRVHDFEQGAAWYERWIGRAPDFVPHDHFVEWELMKGCWLQLAVGEPAVDSGPIRLGVPNIEAERNRIITEFGIEVSEVECREGVPVRWCNFSDPYGNKLGYYEYLKKS